MWTVFLLGGIFWLCKGLDSSGKNILRSVGIITSIISIVFGLAFSIEGCAAGLYYQNNNEFKKIESIFTPIIEIIKKN